MHSQMRAKSLIRGFYPILDPSLAPDFSSFFLAENILSSHVGLLQLRHKSLKEEDFLNLAMEISYLRIHNRFALIINHFVSVAQAIDADGVHLASSSMSIGQARKIMGSQALIGVSVHSVEEALLKEEEGADYLTFGAIYPTQGKRPGHPVQGIENLKCVCESVSIPVVAIGGINQDRVREVKQAGAAAFCALSAVYHPSQTAQAVKSLCRAWEEG